VKSPIRAAAPSNRVAVAAADRNQLNVTFGITTISVDIPLRSNSSFQKGQDGLATFQLELLLPARAITGLIKTYSSLAPRIADFAPWC